MVPPASFPFKVFRQTGSLGWWLFLLPKMLGPGMVTETHQHFGFNSGTLRANSTPRLLLFGYIVLILGKSGKESARCFFSDYFGFARQASWSKPPVNHQLTSSFTMLSPAKPPAR